MRNLKWISVAFCLLLLGCEKDTLEINNDVIETSGYSLETNISGRGVTPPTAGEIFENKMAWTAFISAKVIFQSNNQFKNTFIALLDNENRIPIVNLVGDNSQFSEFNSAFNILLNEYVQLNVGCPGGERELPDDFNNDNTEMFMSDSFLQYILEDNCIELYFPVGIHLGNNDVVSVAHPLNNAPNNTYANHGIIRSLAPQNCSETNSFYVHPTIVNTQQQYTTFIAARPLRRSLNIDCAYGQYSMDFALFLYRP
jgi:hypothetical protein